MKSMQSLSRPILNKNLSSDDFKNFYWLKKELVVFCRIHGISTSGGKIEITERIKKFLETGIAEKNPTVKKTKVSSKFNWNTENLSTETFITDSYKNTENVRQFFKNHIGPHFHFSTAFMNWMKGNTGNTLQEAINEWIKLNEKSKEKSSKTEIPPQFEYNRFIRDFLKNNPGMKLMDAINEWKRIRNEKGSNAYTNSRI